MSQDHSINDITKELQEEFPELADQIPSLVDTILTVQISSYKEGALKGFQEGVTFQKKSQRSRTFLNLIWAVCCTPLLFAVFQMLITSQGMAFFATALTVPFLIMLFSETLDSTEQWITQFLNKKE